MGIIAVRPSSADVGRTARPVARATAQPGGRARSCRRSALLGLMALTAVLLGACASPRIQGRAERGTEGRYQLRITATSFKFTPNEIRAAAGAPLVLTVTNAASIGHNVTVETSAGQKLVSQDIPAGQTATVQVSLPQGRFLLYCDVFGHKLLGMEGAITAE